MSQLIVQNGAKLLPDVPKGTGRTKSKVTPVVCDVVINSLSHTFTTVSKSLWCQINSHQLTRYSTLIT